MVSPSKRCKKDIRKSLSLVSPRKCQQQYKIKFSQAYTNYRKKLHEKGRLDDFFGFIISKLIFPLRLPHSLLSFFFRQFLHAFSSSNILGLSDMILFSCAPSWSVRVVPASNSILRPLFHSFFSFLVRCLGCIKIEPWCVIFYRNISHFSLLYVTIILYLQCWMFFGKLS